MATRHDAVLAVIPLLALGVPALDWIGRSVEDLAGVGTEPALAVGGLLALCVIVRETTVANPTEH